MEIIESRMRKYLICKAMQLLSEFARQINFSFQDFAIYRKTLFNWLPKAVFDMQKRKLSFSWKTQFKPKIEYSLKFKTWLLYKFYLYFEMLNGFDDLMFEKYLVQLG